jgi:hypothetical protein
VTVVCGIEQSTIFMIRTDIANHNEVKVEVVAKGDLKRAVAKFTCTSQRFTKTLGVVHIKSFAPGDVTRARELSALPHIMKRHKIDVMLGDMNLRDKHDEGLMGDITKVAPGFCFQPAPIYSSDGFLMNNSNIHDSIQEFLYDRALLRESDQADVCAQIAEVTVETMLYEALLNGEGVHWIREGIADDIERGNLEGVGSVDPAFLAPGGARLATWNRNFSDHKCLVVWL